MYVKIFLRQKKHIEMKYLIKDDHCCVGIADAEIVQNILATSKRTTCSKRFKITILLAFPLVYSNVKREL